MKQLVADHDKYEPGQPPSIYFALADAGSKVQAAILRKDLGAHVGSLNAHSADILNAIDFLISGI